MSDWQDRKQCGYPKREDWQAGRCLGPAELAALQDGERVSVIWCGGNGPHLYTAKRSPYGILAAIAGMPDGHENVLYAANDTDEPHALTVWVERAETG